MSSPMKGVGAAVLALVAGWVGYAIRGDPEVELADEPQDARPATAVRATAGERATPPETLAACRERLVRRDVELAAAQRTAARAVAGDLFDADDLGLERRPRPAEGGGGGAGTADVVTSATVQTEEERAASARRQEVRTKVGASLAEQLQLSDEERQVATDLVCPSRQNRRELFGDFAEGRIDDEALWRGVRGQRDAVQEGLTQTLGQERVDLLRDLGGVSIIAQTLCPRR